MELALQIEYQKVCANCSSRVCQGAIFHLSSWSVRDSSFPANDTLAVGVLPTYLQVS